MTGGRSYPQLLRVPGNTWSRSLGGAIGVVFLWLLLSSVVATLVLTTAWAIGHREIDQAEFFEAARRFEYWVGILASHLSIALIIPVVWAMMRFVHDVPAGYLWSVEERPRWRYLGWTVAVALVVYGAYVALNAFAGKLSWQPQQDFWAFFIVIVLTTPFQAAAEEFLFRGYLMMTLGSLVRTPWFGIVASALAFALFHGVQNLPLFLSRFSFGLVAGWLVVRTGGLEAAIAAHVVHNIFSFTMAGLTSSIAQVRTTTAIGWSNAFSDVIVFTVFAALATLIAWRVQLPSRTKGTPDLIRGR